MNSISRNNQSSGSLDTSFSDSGHFNKSISSAGGTHGGLGLHSLPHAGKISPSSSLTREASTVATQLAEVEHVMEQGKLQRSLSRNRRDSELKDLQERLQREVAEKRMSRLAQRLGEIPTGGSVMTPGQGNYMVVSQNSTSELGVTDLAVNPDGEQTINTQLRQTGSITNEAAADNANVSHLSSISVLSQVKKELHAKLPPSSMGKPPVSPNSQAFLSPLSSGLGAPVTRSRSRSGSANARPCSTSVVSNASKSILTAPTLYRVVGEKRYTVLIMPTAHKIWLRANDSHVLITPTENAATLADTSNNNSALLYEGKPVPEKNSTSILASISVWHGSKSPKFKRVKAMEFANLVRELELFSRATINEVFNERETYTYFWKPLGVQIKDEVNNIVNDLPESTTEVKSVALYGVSDVGKIEDPECPILESPRIPNSALESGKAYIVIVHLNEENSKPLAWIWTGRGCYLPNLEALTMQVEVVFLTQTPVRLVNEGDETATFKEHFGQLGRSNSFSSGLSGMSRSNSMARDRQVLSLAEVAKGEDNFVPFSLLTEFPNGFIASPALTSNPLTPTGSPLHTPKITEKGVCNWNDIIPASPHIPMHSIMGNPEFLYVITGNSVFPISLSIGEFFSESIYLIISNQGTAVKWVGSCVSAADASRPMGSAVEALTRGRKLLEVYQYREPPEFLSLFPWIVYRSGAYQEEDDVVGKIELYGVVGTRTLEQIPVGKNAVWFTPCAQFALRVGTTTYTTFKAGCTELPVAFGSTTVVSMQDFQTTLHRVTTGETGSIDISPQRLVRGSQPVKALILRMGASHIKELSHPTWQDCHDDSVCFFDLGTGQLLVWIGCLVKSPVFIESVIQLATKYNGGTSNDKIFVTKAADAPEYLRSMLPGSPYFETIRSSREAVSQDVETLSEYLNGNKTRTFMLEELQKRKGLPSSIDNTRLETYLNDSDFEKCFKMTRSTFSSLPQWKQQDYKKKLGLF